jgi:uncharacterized protein (TIGR03067 family)
MNRCSVRRGAALVLMLGATLLVGLSAPGRAGDKGSKDRPQGKWTVTKMIENGRSADEAAGAFVMDFKGDDFTLSFLGKSEGGTFKVDTTKTPKQFEIKLGINLKAAPGIYKIENDVLTMCFNVGGQARPTKFESAAGSRNVLMVLKRGEAKTDPAKIKTITVELPAQRTRSANNLKQLALAMHNYHDANGALPARAVFKNGKPLLSWRVAILPYIEEGQLYQQFKLDEPWDSDHNKKLLAKMPKIYEPVRGKTKEPHSTFYQVFTGPGTPFEGDKGLRLPEFKDGTSNTALIAVAGEGVPWTKPADLTYDPQKDLPKLGGHFPDGFWIAVADGSVRWIRRDFDVPTFRLLITHSDGKPVDWSKVER